MFVEEGGEYQIKIISLMHTRTRIYLKFGDESPTEIQLCLVNGIHIAIMGVTYSKE